MGGSTTVSLNKRKLNRRKGELAVSTETSERAPGLMHRRLLSWPVELPSPAQAVLEPGTPGGLTDSTGA